MSQALLKLEVFETAAFDDPSGSISQAEAEKTREAAYEQGYAAGWHDALEQMRDEDALRRIAAEEALQAIRFSYAEAHQALSQSFVALSEAMLQQLMPRAAQAALPALLAEELATVIAQGMSVQIEIRCAPSAMAALGQIVAATGQEGITLSAEPSFADAQVSVQLDAQEREINLNSVLAALSQLLERTRSQEHKETQHG